MATVETYVTRNVTSGESTDKCTDRETASDGALPQGWQSIFRASCINALSETLLIESVDIKTTG